jgi:hypothetical protein
LTHRFKPTKITSLASTLGEELMAAQFERFATPDEYAGTIKVSDLAAYERFRVITDAHHFLVPIILFGAAFFVWRRPGLAGSNSLTVSPGE